MVLENRALFWKQAVSGPGSWFPHLARLHPLSPPLALQESEGGLYICMNTFLGFGKQYVERHFNKTGQRVYLHLRRTRRPVGTGWGQCLGTFGHVLLGLHLESVSSILTSRWPQFPTYFCLYH